MKHLTEEQKDLISGLSAPSQLDVQEICLLLQNTRFKKSNYICPLQVLGGAPMLVCCNGSPLQPRRQVCYKSFQRVLEHMSIFSPNTLKQCASRPTCCLDGKVFSGSWKPQQEARGSIKPKKSGVYFISLLLLFNEVSTAQGVLACRWDAPKLHDRTTDWKTASHNLPACCCPRRSVQIEGSVASKLCSHVGLALLNKHGI